MTAVTVVIPAFRAETFVADAVRSVLSQTQRPLEVVVVDDCSDDGTPQVLQSLRPEAEVLGIGYRVVRHVQNAGAAAALQTGIATATTEAICWLSADDLFVDPDKLLRQASQLHSSAGMVYDSAFLTGADLDSARVVRADWPAAMRVSAPLRRGESAALLLGMFFANPVNGSTVMLARSLLDEVGGFDPALGNVDADADLWMRILASGRPLSGHMGAPSVFYRVHAGQTSANRAGMASGMAVSRIRVMDALLDTGRLDRVLSRGRSILAGALVNRQHRALPTSTQYLISAAPANLPEWWRRTVSADLRRTGSWLDDADLAAEVAGARLLSQSPVFQSSIRSWRP